VDQQTKAALKQDKFVETTTTGVDWARENRQTVIVAAAALLLVIVLVVGGFALYSHRSDQASIAFGGAMQAYQTPLAEPGQAVPPGVKTYPTVAARAQAANTQFVAVADQYNLTPVGNVARYFAGLTFIESGQNASAETALLKVAHGWNGDLAALAKLSLAQLYRQTGRDPQAIDIYNQLSAKPTTTVPAGLAQLQLAELYDSEGNTAKAKQIYAQLKDKDPKSAVAQVASQKLNPAPAAPQGAPAE